jgi:hypothetical protein
MSLTFKSLSAPATLPSWFVPTSQTVRVRKLVLVRKASKPLQPGQTIAIQSIL